MDAGSPSTLVYYATRSGGSTKDEGEGGGNPFASALIEVAGEGLELRSVARRLRKLTAEKSDRWQRAECVGTPRLPAWRLRQEPDPKRESRRALVLVVSDYSDSRFASLPGAARDERRIAAMFAQLGFSVEQGVGRRREDLLGALASFRRRSRSADIAAIYSTGHGFELDGIVYLVPGDFPAEAGASQLRRYGISVPRMTTAASAAGQNLVLFAGCRTYARDDPASGAREPLKSGSSRRPSG